MSNCIKCHLLPWAPCRRRNCNEPTSYTITQVSSIIIFGSINVIPHAPFWLLPDVVGYLSTIFGAEQSFIAIEATVNETDDLYMTCHIQDDMKKYIRMRLPDLSDINVPQKSWQSHISYSQPASWLFLKSTTCRCTTIPIYFLFSTIVISPAT